MYLCTVKPVLSSHPQDIAFHRIGLLLKMIKRPCYAIIDHLCKKKRNSLKILLTLISGEKHRLNFTTKIIVLIEWFLSMRLFITGGRQYKQVVVTHSKVTTAIKEKRSWRL